MSVQKVLLPRTSDDMREGVVGNWLAANGSSVAKGDPIVEVETDKAMIEVPATVAGVLIPLADAGSRVELGSTLAIIIDGADADEYLAGRPTADVRDLLKGGVNLDGVPGNNPANTGSDVSAAAKSPHEARSRDLDEQENTSGQRVVVFLSPLARKMAREANIDVQSLPPGSGSGGRIVRSDIQGLIDLRDEAALAQAPTPAETPLHIREANVTALSPRQATMARRMVESRQSIPEFYLSREVDVTKLLALRAQLSVQTGKKYSLTAFLVRAVGLALEAHPALRARWTQEGIAIADDYAVGVAVALEEGDLAVPVLRRGDLTQLGLISEQFDRLVETAQRGKLSARDLAGASVTVSNLGMYGVDQVFPIIPPEQCAILGVGRAMPTVVLDESGLPASRSVVTVVLASDHRLVSGAVAAKFLGDIAGALERPLLLLA